MFWYQGRVCRTPCLPCELHSSSARKSWIISDWPSTWRALSRSSKKILHVDEHEYYGGAEAAFSLQEVDEWVEKFRGGKVHCRRLWEFEAYATQILLWDLFDVLLYGRQTPKLRRKPEACLSQERTPLPCHPRSSTQNRSSWHSWSHQRCIDNWHSRQSGTGGYMPEKLGGHYEGCQMVERISPKTRASTTEPNEAWWSF